AAQHVDPTITSCAAGWLGWLRYREKRFAEAAEQHMLAARSTPIETRRLASELDAASAWLEAGEVERAHQLAVQCEDVARRARHSLFEARAAQLSRAADYRRGQQRSPDAELLDGIAALGLEFRAAMAALTEAGFAWRSQRAAEAAQLADRSAVAFRRCRAAEG